MAQLPINQISTAITTPMTTTEFWYGVALTLGFRKHLQRVVNGVLGTSRDVGGRVKQRVLPTPTQSSNQSSTTGESTGDGASETTDQ